MTVSPEFRNFLLTDPRPFFVALGGLTGFVSGIFCETLRIRNPIGSVLKAGVTFSAALHVWQATSTETGQKTVNNISPALCAGLFATACPLGQRLGEWLVQDVREASSTVLRSIRHGLKAAADDIDAIVAAPYMQTLCLTL